MPETQPPAPDQDPAAPPDEGPPEAAEPTSEPDWSAGHWRVDGSRTIEVGGPDSPVDELRVHLVGGRVSVDTREPDAESGPAEDVRVSLTRRSGVPLEVRLADGVLDVGHPRVGWENVLDRVRSWFARDDAADVSVVLPGTATVAVSTVTADVSVTGREAAVNVRSLTGDVTLDGLGAGSEATVRTVSGNLAAHGLAGTLTAESVSGDLTVKRYGAPGLQCRSLSGDVRVDLGDGHCELDVSTVSGAVTARVPAGTGYEVRARSVSGRVVAGTEQLDGGSSGVEGRLSSGEPEAVLTARTVTGDITLIVGERPGDDATDEAGRAAGDDASGN